jgi:hypothetical protein
MLRDPLALNETDMVRCYRCACAGTEIEMDPEVRASVTGVLRELRDDDDMADDTGWR